MAGHGRACRREVGAAGGARRGCRRGTQPGLLCDVSVFVMLVVREGREQEGEEKREREKKRRREEKKEKGK
jgi:hypothetical protein